MKYLSALFFIGLFIFSAAAQDIAEIDLIVNNVANGTPYSTVIKNLGKPESETNLDEELDECTDGRGKTLFYEGLTLKMMGDENGKKLTVLDMKITSAKWATSNGIKIGSSAKDVMAKYGKTDYEDAFDYKEGSGEKVFTGEKWLAYSMKTNGPGGTTFYFKGDKLVRIELRATTC